MKNNNFGAIDLFRLIAAVLVIAIHVPAIPFLSEAGNLLLSQIIARLAVPFFFSVTGFFVDLSNAASVKKLVIKNSLIYIAATAIYLPYGSYDSTIKQLLFDGTYYHLWYFPAVMLGAVIVYGLRKLSAASAVVIALLLYAFGLAGDSYRMLAEKIDLLDRILDNLSGVFSYTRNGFFFAPLFMLIGNIIGNKIRRDLAENRRPISIFISLPCLALSIFLLGIEWCLLAGKANILYYNMFISLIPCIVFLMLLLSAIELKPYPILRRISMWIYIVHPIFINLIGCLINYYDKTTGRLNSNASSAIVNASISIVNAVIFGILLFVKRKETTTRSAGSSS